MAKQFVIVDDTRDGSPRWFVRLSLGVFWECSHIASEAHRFSTRAAASKMLVGTGKNRQGWRVVAV